MSTSHVEISSPLSTTTFPISAEERARETALRKRFADFWGNAKGPLRDIYDTFIAACPIAEGVSEVSVSGGGVEGWWLRPTSERQERAILFLHGGGYVQGSAKAYCGLASQIASRTRVPVLAIDYPLAPEAVLPAALEAVMVAWRWLRSATIKKIAIVGDSAGGGLTFATLAALRRATDGASAVAGVAFSPWVDLALTGRSMTDPTIGDPIFDSDYFFRDSAQKYLGGADPRDPRGSPLFGEHAGLPPLLIQVGTDERLLDDSRQYAEKAARAGVPVRLEIWQGMHHVFQLDVAHLESSRVALDRAAAFLTEAFSRG